MKLWVIISEGTGFGKKSKNQLDLILGGFKMKKSKENGVKIG